MPAAHSPSWFRLPVITGLGEFEASYSERGLAELRFPSGQRASVVVARATIPAQISQWHRMTSAAVRGILTGHPVEVLPPLDLSRGTEFQQSVWHAMTRISWGRTSSYGELAHAIGKPKAVRAVGGACGANPIPVLIPCHRVLAASQKLGGFSGGLDWKRKLLAREGVRLS